MQQLHFDHYTIKVMDLSRSSRFYGEILGLQEIENRTQKPYIRWFSIGERNELHVVEGLQEPVQSNIGVHLALRLSDFDAFMLHLEEHGITPHNSKGVPGEITVRTDGVRQVYFPDPDGYWIEVNEANG
jgi:catechol 2,3-dioxygenase-like lactoylglutathione lyase family enzyme